MNDERVLRETADELLADAAIANVVALFPDPRRRRARNRGSRPVLLALMVLSLAAATASVVAAQITGAVTYLAGIVLIVPAFPLVSAVARLRRSTSDTPV